MENIELLYFYFFEHSFLKGLGVNLSQEFYFNLDDDYNLNIEPIKSVNLFRNSSISNFNLIVGKNGVGKTTIIREIYSFLHGSVDEKKIIALKKNSTIFIYYSNRKVKFNERKAKQMCADYDFQVINDGFILNDIVLVDITEEECDLEVKSIVYISNFADASTETSSHRFGDNHAFNFSPLALINRPEEFLNYHSNPIRANLNRSVSNYILINKIKQIEFLANKKYEFDFISPQNIKIYFYNIINKLEKRYFQNKFKFSDSLNQWIKLILDNEKRSSDKLKDILDLHLIMIIYNLTNIENLAIDYQKAIDINDLNKLTEEELEVIRKRELDYFKRSVSDVIIEYLRGRRNPIDMLIKFSDMFKTSIIEDFYSRIDDKDLDVFSSIQSSIQIYEKLYEIGKKHFNKEGHFFELDINDAGEFLSIYTLFRDNTDIHNISSVCMPDDIKYYYNSDEFYFSSGQENILKIFTYLDMTIENLRLMQSEREISLIILLDEPTNSLHPELQKTFIGHLNRFLNKYYDCSFHIIMTSHSPIVTGDLTSNHIAFLYNDIKDGKNTVRALDVSEKPKTFAQNIYNLYRSSFFVEDGLIGTFSDGILANILNRIKRKEIDEYNCQFSFEEMQTIIEEIGEPLLREKFLELIDEKDKKKLLIEKLMNEKIIDDNLKEEILSVLLKDWGRKDDTNQD